MKTMNEETKMKVLGFVATGLGIAGSLLSGVLSEKKAEARIREMVKAEMAVTKKEEETKEN